MFLALLHTGAMGLSLSLAFSGFMIAAGLGDIPDGRSSHEKATPTAGGIGLVAGLAGMMLGLGLYYPYLMEDSVLPQLLMVAAAIAALGLWDDILVSRAWFKFLLMAVLCGLSVWIIGPVTSLPFGVTDIALPAWLGALGTGLWIFVVMNGVNFMDGTNGLMASVMLVASLALLGIALTINAPTAAIISAALAVGLLGFLPYNFRRRAAIFCGDVGSLLVGFLFAVAAVILVIEVPIARALYVGPILLLPFLTDILLTLLRRWRQKKRLMQPHCDHLYQRAIQSGLSHRFVAIAYSLVGILCAVIVYLALARGLIGSLSSLLMLAAVFAFYYYFSQRRLDRVIARRSVDPVNNELGEIT